MPLVCQLFGLRWGIGLPATRALYTTAVRDTFSILFIFLTAFQGLFVFIMHCARSTEVVKQWKKWFSCVTGKQSLDITSSVFGKAHHARPSTTGPTHSTILSEEKGTLKMISRQPCTTNASASEEFSFQLSDDDDAMSTLKRNVAKSRSLPETIAEKEKVAELADIESLEEEGAMTTFKLPAQLLVSGSMEFAEEFSLGGDADHDFEKSTCFTLPVMPHSTSNPSFQSITSETDAQETSINNPMFTGKK